MERKIVKRIQNTCNKLKRRRISLYHELTLEEEQSLPPLLFDIDRSWKEEGRWEM
jgi:hypothetical protein